MSKDETVNLAWVPDWTLPDRSIRTYSSGNRLVLEAEQDASMGDILRQVSASGWVAVGDGWGGFVSTLDRPVFTRFYFKRRF